MSTKRMSRNNKDDQDRWARFVQQALGGKNLHEPPEHVLRQAFALGERLRKPAKPSVLDLVQLLFDSGAEPLPAGVRGAATGPRRLLYSIGGESQPGTLELDVQLRRRENGGVDLTGQLLPPLEDANVELVIPASDEGRGSKASTRSVALGAAGEFRFRNLRTSATAAEIHIASPHHRITVWDVPLESNPNGVS